MPSRTWSSPFARPPVSDSRRVSVGGHVVYGMLRGPRGCPSCEKRHAAAAPGTPTARTMALYSIPCWFARRLCRLPLRPFCRQGRVWLSRRLIRQPVKPCRLMSMGSETLAPAAPVLYGFRDIDQAVL